MQKRTITKAFIFWAAICIGVVVMVKISPSSSHLNKVFSTIAGFPPCNAPSAEMVELLPSQGTATAPFTLTASFDRPDTPEASDVGCTKFYLDFDDGTPPIPLVGKSTVHHTFTDAGIYDVALLDYRNQTIVDKIQISGTPLRFRFQAGKDPLGINLMYKEPANNVVTYKKVIDFGDGTFDIKDYFPTACHGTTYICLQAGHVYKSAGTYTIKMLPDSCPTAFITSCRQHATDRMPAPLREISDGNCVPEQISECRSHLTPIISTTVTVPLPRN